MGAFQVRQFLLTSYASERALLCAVADVLRRDVAARHLQRQDVRRPGHGDALAVPPDAAAARVGAALRHAASGAAAVARAGEETREGCTRVKGGCRLGTLERVLCDVTRVGDIPGMDIPGALLPVPAQRRRAPAGAGPRAQPPRSDFPGGGLRARRAARGRGNARGAATRPKRWRSARSTSAPAASIEAMASYRHAADDPSRAHRRRAGSDLPAGAAPAARPPLRGSGGLLAATAGREAAARYAGRRSELLAPLRQYAVEALAIHHEHRERDYEGAKELTLQSAGRVRRRELPPGHIRVAAEATRSTGSRASRKRSPEKTTATYSHRWLSSCVACPLRPT